MRIAIIGAGFGGIGLGIELRRAGFADITIVDRAAGVGGTWRENTYPGAACDVPSHLYSFSFEPYAGWTRSFATQPEILAYLERCVDKYDLRRHLRLRSEVTEAAYDERTHRWRLSFANGTTDEADVLVSACGQLNRPLYPQIAGRDQFAGASFHSSRWDHGNDLAGKRVAVIGTGASAIQFVPAIAPRVAHLDLYQRTPPYVIPRPDRPYPPLVRAALHAFPVLQRLNRAVQYVTHEARALGFTQCAWAMRFPRANALRFLRGQVPDPTLRGALEPDYPIGCKRILLSNDYYPALQRTNVRLVRDPVERIEPEGVVAGGVLRPADVLIYGTGFTATDFLVPMRVHGRGGADLHETWRAGAEAYLGISVSGFPNFFMLYGPNTNLGHSSIVYMLESQIRYVVRAVQALARGDIRALDVRSTTQSAFNVQLQRRMQRTIWAAGCSSWYQTASGKHTNNWPGFTFAYRRRTARLVLADYDVVRA